MLDTQALLAAAASNHRAWFRRSARANGGRSERFGALDLLVGADRGVVAFPRSRAPGRLDEVTARARQLRLAEVGSWSLLEDNLLGTRLVARGWQWGWQPHWMGLALDELGPIEIAHRVVPFAGDAPERLPYRPSGPLPARAHHLAVRRGRRIIGHATVHPWRGMAGIYSMGVLPRERRKGVGRSLTLAACRLAGELGCTHVTVNSTEAGEPLYRGAGFASLGRGRMGWLFPGPQPSPRQTALAEAIGLGDLDGLAALGPTATELEAELTTTVPLALAVLTAQPASIEWILDRRPELVSRPLDSEGRTLLHVAVEENSIDALRVALARGADRDIRDDRWDGRPLDWAEHLGRSELAELLRDG
jgi:GNAT superfamily N-acetyltransferase